MNERKAEDLAADYNQAGFGKRIGFGKRPVLNVVDFVLAYLDPSSPLYAGVETELEVTRNLVGEARIRGVPVIFSRVEYEPGGADGGHFYRKIESLKVFDRGSPLGAFPETLRPEESETVIVKQYASNFFGTGLADHLRRLDCDTLIISGVTTSGCVRATALDALQNGFIPVVVADACGDRDARVQEANLFDLGAKYADVVSSGEVIDYFRSRV